ncbi:MAG: AMP-binding protein, partial [Acidimicrobiia bacterium]|nr:AMP-binding protein [Acidimicrobiia bacterium]
MTQLFSSEEIARYKANGWWRDTTYLDDFDAQVRARPDQLAIVSHRAGADGEPHHLTYAELDRHVNRMASALVGLGLQRGEAVSMQLPNGWQFAALVMACARAGLVANPLVPIFRHREMTFILERTGARFCVVPRTFRGYDHGAMLEQIQADLPALEHALVLGESFDDIVLGRTWEDDVDLAGRALTADELAEIQFTSGTTGEPKGVQHTPNTIYGGARGMFELSGLKAGEVIHMASTLAHQTGFLYGLVMPLSQGMTVVYQDVWDADAFLDLVEGYGISFSMGATPFVVDSV